MLSFNNKGSTHNTLFGGSVSMMIKSMLVIYIIILIKKLTFYEDDKNTSIISRQDLQELGTVNFNET